MKRTPIRKVSKKNWWAKLRPSLVKSFGAAGIIRCEIGAKGCWRDNALGFAHSKKRRNITTEEERREVILACCVCHDVIELFSEAEMGQTIREIISKRKTQPA